MAEEINAADELDALQKKRTTLKKIVRMALAVERLHDSLQSVVLLGESSTTASPKIKALVSRLDESVCHQPSARIKETLICLEKMINNKLEIILEIAEMDDEQLLSLSTDESQVELLLKSYSKNSQTAVALKGLLHSRGEAIRPSVFCVSTDIIVKKLAVVSARERSCRHRVTLSIMNMISETKELLTTPGLPDGMFAIMESTINNLGLNLEHIKSGQEIGNMPVPIEIVEIAGDQVISIDEGEKTEQHFTPNQTAPALKQKDEKPFKKRNFIETVMRWLTTPKNITWDDIKNGRD